MDGVNMEIARIGPAAKLPRLSAILFQAAPLGVSAASDLIRNPPMLRPTPTIVDPKIESVGLNVVHNRHPRLANKKATVPACLPMCRLANGERIRKKRYPITKITLLKGLNQRLAFPKNAKRHKAEMERITKIMLSSLFRILFWV